MARVNTPVLTKGACVSGAFVNGACPHPQTGSASDYDYSIYAGTVPAGFVFDPDTGAISNPSGPADPVRFALSMRAMYNGDNMSFPFGQSVDIRDNLSLSYAPADEYVRNEYKGLKADYDYASVFGVEEFEIVQGQNLLPASGSIKFSKTTGRFTIDVKDEADTRR